jgi:hypothetical protein
MPLDQWSMSLPLTVSNQFTMHTFIRLKNTELCLGVIIPKVGRISLYKSKSSNLWLLNDAEPLVGKKVKQSRYRPGVALRVPGS